MIERGLWLTDPLVELKLSDEHKAALITTIEEVVMPTAHTSPGTNTMRECQADLTTESRKWSCQRTALKAQPVDTGEAVVASADHKELVGFIGNIVEEGVIELHNRQIENMGCITI